MRSIKTKASKSRGRTHLQKRGSASWRLESTMRSFWSNFLIKSVFIGGILCSFSAMLWLTGYPQRLNHFVCESMVDVTKRMGLRVSDVFVEGRQNVPLEKILKVINVQRGAPLLSYDPYQMKKQLEEISWVRQATVKRQLPGIIFIQLSERHPVALWQHQQQLYLVDEKGVIISGDNLQIFDKLPIIVGGDAPVHAPHILHLLESFPDLRKKLTALVRVGGRRWNLHLSRSLQIKLPEINVEKALVRLDMLIKQKKINPSAVSVIDLRVQNQMVMRLSPAAAVRLKGNGKET